MDLHQLRCFIAVAEELNFGRAAARLHMTQPPLSRQIQLLEKSLGGALFERNNSHVQLTHMGQHLLTESRLILKLADRLNPPFSNAHPAKSARYLWDLRRYLPGILFRSC
jgi:DNA-binding transcriptional LysR family regulator